MAVSGWRVYLGVVRARFLLLSVVSIGLALVLVTRQRGLDSMLWLDAGLVLLAALAAHAAVNALNEYGDYRSGLDLLTRRTPFSGGSGTLVVSPAGLGIALWGGLLSLALCCGIGLLLMLRHGEQAGAMLGFGLFGMLLILLYTPVLTRHPWWCLAAPGTGFGLCMLPAAVLALGGQLDAELWCCGLILVFFCNNLLLVNQLPDIDADRLSGRRTLAMLLGLSGVRRLLLVQWLLAALLLLAFLSQVALVLVLLLPMCVLVWCGLPLVPAAGKAGCRVMGINVILTLTAPAFLALGLAMGS